MIAGRAFASTPTWSPNDQELIETIHVKTHRQVRELGIKREGPTVVLTGSSRSYYVKQLATHALLDLVPDADLQNAIAVRPEHSSLNEAALVVSDAVRTGEE